MGRETTATASRGKVALRSSPIAGTAPRPVSRRRGRLQGPSALAGAPALRAGSGGSCGGAVGRSMPSPNERSNAMSATEAVRPIRVPIARYEVETGPRLLVAVGRRRAHGEVAIDQIVDRPENGSGRSYLVESNIQPGDHLRSLVADYTRQAADLGHPPMSAEALEVLLARDSRVREAIS